ASCSPSRWSRSPRWKAPNSGNASAPRARLTNETSGRYLLRLGRALAARHLGRQRQRAAVRVRARGTTARHRVLAALPEAASGRLRQPAAPPAPAAGIDRRRAARWLGHADDGQAVSQAGLGPNAAVAAGRAGLHRRARGG